MSAVDTAEQLAVSIVELVVEQYGLPLLAKLFAKAVPQDQANAILEAEYAAARAAADAVAVAIVDG